MRLTATSINCPELGDAVWKRDLGGRAVTLSGDFRVSRLGGHEWLSWYRKFRVFAKWWDNAGQFLGSKACQALIAAMSGLMPMI